MFDKDIEIKGKHASYVKYLNTKENEGAFIRYIDVYMIGAIWGILHNTNSKVDNSSKDTARIFTEVLIRERNKLEIIYRLIMMIDDSRGLSVEEKINKTFRDDTDIQALEKNLEIFHSYALGGIEALYESFKDCTTKDDLIDQVYEMVDGFYKDNYCTLEDYEGALKEIVD